MQFLTLVAATLVGLSAATPSTIHFGPTVHRLTDAQCKENNFPFIDHDTVGQNLIIRNAAEHTIWVGGQMQINGQHEHFPANDSKIKLEPHSCTLIQDLPTRGETGPRMWTVYRCDENGENCVAPTED